MALSAIIFDVDGTLVDSNPAHLQAWTQSLQQHGYQIAPDRLAVEIGKGGDKLVPDVLGQAVEKKDGRSLRESQKSAFLKLAGSQSLKLFNGVETLLRLLKDRDLTLALATSGSKEALKSIGKSAGIRFEDFFQVITTADDAEQSKPAPDLINAALKKLKMSPAQCAMVGDTPHDAMSARDAGVACLGFTCGKMNDREKLREYGMRAVFEDPAQMAGNLDAALLSVSPGTAVLTDAMAELLMELALTTAQSAMDHGEAPIGCVLARGDGTVISSAHNEMNTSQRPTAHAEMVAFTKAAGKIPEGTRDLILVTTLEPCVMCMGAAMETAVDTVLYALPAPLDGGTRRIRPPVGPDNQTPRVIGNILADRSRKLLQQFLKHPQITPHQTEFIRTLVRTPTED